MFLGVSTVVVEGVYEDETMEALAVRKGMAQAADLQLRDFE